MQRHASSTQQLGNGKLYQSYSEKLKDARWLKKRHSLMQNRGDSCQSCGSGTALTVHHGYYRPQTDPWDYEDASLWILCWPCHIRVQATLTAIHQIIGHIHPDEYTNVKTRVTSSTFELVYGITQEDLNEIVAEEKRSESTLYDEYEVSILSSNELGPTRATELEDALQKRFPGIGSAISNTGEERDATAIVSGPDVGMVSGIQNWCNRWRT